MLRLLRVFLISACACFAVRMQAAVLGKLKPVVRDEMMERIRHFKRPLLLRKE